MIEIKIIISETKQGRTHIEMKFKAEKNKTTVKERKAAFEVNILIRNVLKQFTLTKKDPAIAVTKEDVETLRGLENIDI